MLRAKAPEKPTEAGRQIGAAAVASALGLGEPAAPAPEPLLPPPDPKRQSNIEALVRELAEAVAGREPTERKALIAQARQAFEASRRSAMPPPGESAVLADLKAFDDAAAMVVADVPVPPSAAPAESPAPTTPPPIPSSLAMTETPAVTPAYPPKAEQAAPPVAAAVDRGKDSIAGLDAPRRPRAAPPVSLRILLRVLIAAWLVLGGALGYAYLRRPALHAPTPSSVAASPSASVEQSSTPAPSAPTSSPTSTPGKVLPVPDPLIPME